MGIKRSAEEMASEVKAEMKAGVPIGVPRTRWPDKAVVPSPLSMWRKRRGGGREGSPRALTTSDRIPSTVGNTLRTELGFHPLEK